MILAVAVVGRGGLEFVQGVILCGHRASLAVRDADVRPKGGTQRVRRNDDSRRQNKEQRRHGGNCRSE